MRITELINEALDSSYPYEFKNNNYYFTTDKGEEYKVTFSGNAKKVEVSFMARGEDDRPKDNITGAGDSRKVFGTVINIVKNYVDSNNPEILLFAADNREPSRIKLYNALAAQAGRALPNYNFAKSFKSGPFTEYYIVRDDAKISKMDTAKHAAGKALDKVFEAHLMELMDQPYRFMALGSLRGKAKYAFETDAGNVYIVDINYPEGEATVGFGLKDLKSTGRLDKVQGTGDAMRVFSTVIAIVKQFVEKVQPPKIHFDAASSEPSRIKLYQRMAMSADRALPDYTFVGQEPGEHTVKFTLAKKDLQD